MNLLLNFTLLGFLFPPVGLFLFLFWYKDDPVKAKSVGLGALLALVAPVALIVAACIVETLMM